ncbi:hypothetical protein F5B21DRAFT_484267 [Xylaria acuta]|nr:hypothetical protein F5B21DRAFT_484267 [Xylaria acuta]
MTSPKTRRRKRSNRRQFPAEQDRAGRDTPENTASEELYCTFRGNNEGSCNKGYRSMAEVREHLEKLHGVELSDKVQNYCRKGSRRNNRVKKQAAIDEDVRECIVNDLFKNLGPLDPVAANNATADATPTATAAPVAIPTPTTPDALDGGLLIPTPTPTVGYNIMGAYVGVNVRALHQEGRIALYLDIAAQFPQDQELASQTIFLGFVG